MKKLTVLFLAILISSCDVFSGVPHPLPIQTAIASSTPSIVTATPVILQPLTQNPSSTPVSSSVTSAFVTETFLPTITATDQSTPTPLQQSTQSVSVEILGCDTSLDILNGMGEVTNAYVMVKNTGNVDIPNLCALLRAADEGRAHPDKKVCASSLPLQNQITFKLTVDTTYKLDTIIQVDTTTDDVILLRLDKQSCKDINLFGGTPSDIGVVKPAQ